MIIVDVSPKKRVAFFLPEDWWTKRGDVCLYADGHADDAPAHVCFVERSVSGYVPIKLWDGNDTQADEITLTLAEANFLVEEANRETLHITPSQMNEIVWSSMAIQELEERQRAGGAA